MTTKRTKRIVGMAWCPNCERLASNVALPTLHCRTISMVELRTPNPEDAAELKALRRMARAVEVVVPCLPSSAMNAPLKRAVADLKKAERKRRKENRR